MKDSVLSLEEKITQHFVSTFKLTASTKHIL